MNSSDINFESALKSAVKECVDDELAVFKDLDTADVTVPPDVKSNIKSAAEAAANPFTKVSPWIKCIAAIGIVVGMLISAAVITNGIRIIFEYTDRERPPQVIEQQYYPSVPDDWSYAEHLNTKTENYRIYKSPEGQSFVYTQKVYTLKERQQEDKTASRYEQVTLANGVTGTMMTLPENVIILTWYDCYKFEITAHYMSTEEVLEIANSIK